jgi:restriction system protein
MSMPRGPKFIQYFQPVIDGLRELGASAKPRVVYAWIAEHHSISKDEIEGTTKGGQSKFENKVGWARFYLAKAGLIDTEQRGVWVLTEQGRKANLSHEDAYQLFRAIHDGFQRESGATVTNDSSASIEDVDASAPDEQTYLNQDATQQELVSLLRSVAQLSSPISIRLLFPAWRHGGDTT